MDHDSSLQNHPLLIPEWLTGVEDLVDGSDYRVPTDEERYCPARLMRAPDE